MNTALLRRDQERTEKLETGSRNNFFKNFCCKRESGNLVFAEGNVGPKVTFKKKKIRRNNTIFVSHGNQLIERAESMMQVRG